MAQFGREWAKTVRLDVIANPVREQITFRPRENRGHELHHGWISIHLGKWLSVFGMPLPQDQSVGLNNVHSVNARR